MITLLKVIRESILQAFSQLAGNKLRSFLSLLGITIGIFCIIAVQAAVDSLEAEIRGSLEELGDEVVYISKMSWTEDPGPNFWKVNRRPNLTYQDYEAISRKVKTAAAAEYHVFIGMKNMKARNRSAERVATAAATFEMAEVFDAKIARGRWYTQTEYNYGQNKIIIGYKVAELLFGKLDPIGRHAKIDGNKMEVIGVFEKQGDGNFNFSNWDEACIIAYTTAQKIANVKNAHPFGTSINVKAKEGISLDLLKDDITGALRTSRKLKPKEDNNFAMNTISMLTNILGQVFDVIGLGGSLIGIFALLVGMFSVANIMFVSVKERTNIIGIKKALGAKKPIILLEFLIESVILCILGGICGLILVFGILKVLESSMPFPMFLSFGNIIFGVSLSIFIGIVSGFIPAWQAARMNPVDAIRA